jgi:hypothetical protein
MKRSVVVLSHEHDSERDLRSWVITQLAEFWREDGIDVHFLFGVRKFVPADVVIVHVDLSVVPAEYLEFARRYPVAVNAEAKDIRRSSYSRNLIAQHDAYEGPVIVKSDLNFAGTRERWLQRTEERTSLTGLARRMRRAVGRRLRREPAAGPTFRSPADYRIFDHRRDIPASLLGARDVVVERFLPEREGDLYFVRNYHFLGERTICTRMASRSPIVNGTSHLDIEAIEPHPDIVALRREMRFDYGKFDYVEHDGGVVLLDANKTIGAGTIKVTPKLIAERRTRASGIHDFFR